MFSRELVMMVVLLVSSVLFRWFILFCLSRFVWLVIFISVLVVLNSFIRKNISIMFRMLIDSVFMMLSCISVGVSDGGIDIMLWKVLLVKKKFVVVMVRMLIRMVFFMCRWFSVMIMKKLIIVRMMEGWCILFSVMSVVGFLMISFVFCSDMMFRNSLIFVVIVM